MGRPAHPVLDGRVRPGGRGGPAAGLALACALLFCSEVQAADTGAPAIHADDGDFTLDAYAPADDQPSVGGRAALDLRLNGLETRLQANLEGAGLQAGAGPEAVGQSWTGGQARFTATWTPNPAAKVEIDLSNQLKRALSQVNPLAPDVTGQLTNSQTGAAKVDATLAPGGPLELRFGGETASGAVDTLTYAPGAASASDLRSDSARAFAGLTWRPFPSFSLEAGDAVQTLGVAVAGAGAAAATYVYPTPHVSAALKPWSDGEWTLAAERAVTAPNAAQFAAFTSAAALSPRPLAASFQPDRAWRYAASVKQTLPGAVEVEASVVQSQLQSVTDLGPVGSGQAPVSIGAGERREVSLSLSAPVAAPGLPAARLSLKAGWRQSQVTDPFTGLRRPISGDSPYQAEVDLTGALPGAPLSWGLKAQLSGPQSIYQMSEVDMLSPTAGLGGMINYRAGPVTVGLQLDNILGGQRTDTSLYYSGSRAGDLVDGVRQIRDESRAVRLSVSRAL